MLTSLNSLAECVYRAFQFASIKRLWTGIIFLYLSAGCTDLNDSLPELITCEGCYVALKTAESKDLCEYCNFPVEYSVDAYFSPDKKSGKLPETAIPEMDQIRNKLQNIGVGIFNVTNQRIASDWAKKIYASGGDWGDFKKKHGAYVADQYQDVLSRDYFDVFLARGFGGFLNLSNSIWIALFLLIIFFIFKNRNKWLSLFKIESNPTQQIQFLLGGLKENKYSAFLIINFCLIVTVVSNEQFLASLLDLRFFYAAGFLLITIIVFVPLSALFGFIPWVIAFKVKEVKYPYSKFWVIAMALLCLFMVLGKSHLHTYFK